MAFILNSNILLFSCCLIKICEQIQILDLEIGDEFECSCIQIQRCIMSRRVAQLVNALPSVLEVPSSTLSDSNLCLDFSLICVVVVLNTRKMGH